MLYAKKSKAKKDKHSDDRTQKHLRTKPLPQFSLGSTPEIQDIRLISNWHNYPQKIFNSLFLCQKVERKHYNHNERKDASKNYGSKTKYSLTQITQII